MSRLSEMRLKYILFVSFLLYQRVEPGPGNSDLQYEERAR